MGRSPAKWMKTLLFGKKSSRSNGSKKDTNDKKFIGDKDSPATVVDSPVISQPLPGNAGSNVMLEAERGTPSFLSTDGVIDLPLNQNTVQQNVARELSSIPDKIREDKAAVKVQATFRGFLARRAFRALRGIIRLQALVRGHLVRRQAVATLRCMQRVVKLQAVARGRRVRMSDVGFEVNKKISKSSLMRAKLLSSINANNSQKTKLSVNSYVYKLLSESPVFMPLKLQYVTGEPNSVWSWLERWTSSLFWEPLPQQKKTVEVKSQLRHAGYAMETEPGRQKRSLRRNVSPNSDSGLTNFISDCGKAKRTFRKISNTTTEQVQEHPQSELEKVKCNLRKISNSMAQSTDILENEAEKPKNSARKVLSSATETIDHSSIYSAEKVKKNMAAPAPDTELEMKSSKPVLVTDINAETILGPTSEVGNQSECVAITALVQEAEATIKPADIVLEDINASINDNIGGESHNCKIEKHHPLNGELTLKEEITCRENHKPAAKRRASLSEKTEYLQNGSPNTSLSEKTEYLQNGSPNTPTLPSYMQATESAKAKLHGLSSPRFSSDGFDKIGYTRRHSLPSTNGKLGSVPSQVQRIVTGGKGGIRSDKSFSSSRDGSDRPIQVEWRR